MGTLLMKMKEFAANEGLTDVHFYKKWHRYDVYTAYPKDKENEDTIYILIEGDYIRYATPAETERFEEGHNVYNDLPR